MDPLEKQHNILKQLQIHISSDILKPCGASVIHLIHHALISIQTLLESTTKTLSSTDPERKTQFQQISDKMSDCLYLSTEMFYAYPFSSVPLAWKKLYAYTSILKAMAQIGMHETNAEIIKTLDMALIMTGGADVRHFLMELLALQEPDHTNHLSLPTFCIEKDIDQINIHYPIYCAQSPSLETFQNYISTIRQPLIIKNSIDHWPALSENGWANINTLLDKTHQGLRIVPVEIGRCYTDKSWGQQLMPFHEFLRKYILQAEKTSSDARKVENENIGYLAQHDLFSQIPALREHIIIPDYCFAVPPPIPFHLQAYIKEAPTLNEPLLNAWLGGKGTISPLHTDPYHNILSQVVGWKYVRLYAPEENEALYPRSIEDSIDMSNTSQVDLDNPNIEKFPKFLNAKYVEGIIGPGDCLYIPIGWWHYVRSLSTSFSVSFWWN